jgi:hypothetical protein
MSETVNINITEVIEEVGIVVDEGTCDITIDVLERDDLVEVVIEQAGIKGDNGTSYQESFETVSKNLKTNPFVLNYTNDELTSIVYTLNSGTITKTINRTNDVVISIVLSGDLPLNIDTTKTLNYTNEVLTSITYS